MSIAVSAVVKPSRIVFCSTLAASAGSGVIGALLWFGQFESMPLAARGAIAIACLAAGVTAARQILRNRCTRRIDISGNGQIRLAREDQGLPTESRNFLHVRSKPGLTQLLSSSTLWSHLMILNLKYDDGSRTTLLILPDSMPKTSFRGLAVACRWIAAHNNRAERDLN